MIYFYIAAGGAAGAVARYLLSGWVQSGWLQKREAVAFPWGTLTVNVLGCLMMGLLAKLLFDASILRAEYRTAILVGTLGAFTTFSTFSYETLSMLNDGQYKPAIAYVLLTNALCFLAVWAGYRTGESLRA